MLWAAGLFEGEGCVTLSRTRRDYLSLSISMHPRDRDVLERFALAVGAGSLVGPHRNGMLRWAVTGRRAEELVADSEFVDNLGERRRARIRECLDAVHSQPRPMTNRESGHLAGLASGAARRLGAVTP